MRLLWRLWYCTKIPQKIESALRFYRALKFAHHPPASAAHLSEDIRMLMKLNSSVMREQANEELVRQREVLREAGIGPADPRYPDLWDILEGWDERPFEPSFSSRMFKRLGYT